MRLERGGQSHQRIHHDHGGLGLPRQSRILFHKSIVSACRYIVDSASRLSTPGGWTAAFCNIDPSNRGTTGINLLSQVPEVSVLCVPKGCSCVVCKNILEFYVNLIMSTVNNLQFLVAYFRKLPPYLQFLISYNLKFSKFTINPSIVLKQHKIYPTAEHLILLQCSRQPFDGHTPCFFVD